MRVALLYLGVVESVAHALATLRARWTEFFFFKIKTEVRERVIWGKAAEANN